MVVSRIRYIRYIYGKPTIWLTLLFLFHLALSLCTLTGLYTLMHTSYSNTHIKTSTHNYTDYTHTHILTYTLVTRFRKLDVGHTSLLHRRGILRSFCILIKMCFLGDRKCLQELSCALITNSHSISKYEYNYVPSWFSHGKRQEPSR
jgi:hypothetical protein